MKSNHENLNSFIFNFIELCSAFFLDAKKAFKKIKTLTKEQMKASTQRITTNQEVLAKFPNLTNRS